MYWYVYKLLAIFTWDENKRKLNLKNHQLDFADAEKVFRCPTVTMEDARFDYYEQHWYILRTVIVCVL